jgi:hypothetical protein
MPVEEKEDAVLSVLVTAFTLHDVGVNAQMTSNTVHPQIHRLEVYDTLEHLGHCMP